MLPCSHVFCLAISINFSQSLYSVVEGEGSVQLIFILSNPSATEITLTVFSNDGSANGKTG